MRRPPLNIPYRSATRFRVPVGSLSARGLYGPDAISQDHATDVLDQRLGLGPDLGDFPKS
eukprot:m.32058 g.32058  ORF g.32058 m.32058 type:complete len:60 (-) comp7000_c0_seq1:707-886(-)